MKKYLSIFFLGLGLFFVPSFSLATINQTDNSSSTAMANTTVLSTAFIADGSLVNSVTVAGDWTNPIHGDFMNPATGLSGLYGGIFNTTGINATSGCTGSYTGTNFDFGSGITYSTTTVSSILFTTVIFPAPVTLPSNMCMNLDLDRPGHEANGTIYTANGPVSGFSNTFRHDDVNGDQGRLGAPIYMTWNSIPTKNFYAQIKNTGGRFLLRSTPASSTDSNYLERLPQDWTVYVSSTLSTTGTPVIADGFRWYDVVDPTDKVEGWMAATSSAGTVYLAYSTTTLQSDLQGMASTTVVTSTRANLVSSTIDYYYNNSSTIASLYSGHDGGNNFPIFNTRNYPKLMILGIAAWEDGDSTHRFSNDTVTFDYGHGIMQITPGGVWNNEPTSTGNWIHNTGNPWFSTSSVASWLAMYKCPTDATDTYINCYRYGGQHRSLGDESYTPYDHNVANPTYRYYANTSQSIYANIKDGMRILQNKYGFYNNISTSTTIGTTTYSDSDRRTILATEAYNSINNCPYVQSIANTLDIIDQYFPGMTSSSIASVIQKMHIVGQNLLCVQLHSPGDLSIQDSKGRTLGVVDGVIKNDFLFGSYDPDTKSAFILLPPDNNFTYKVVGTGTGVYGLSVTLVSSTQQIAFDTENMPMVPNQIDTYTIDQDAILNNERGVSLAVDQKGDGVITSTTTFSATVSITDSIAFPPPGEDVLTQEKGLPNPFRTPTPVIYPLQLTTSMLSIETTTVSSTINQ